MKKIFLLSFAILLVALSPLSKTVADAQATAGYSISDAGIGKPPTLPGTTKFTTTEINNYIYYLVGALVTLSAALAVFCIYWGGSMYATSMGSDENLGKAKKTIMWAVLGLLQVIVSYQIVVTIITMVFQAPPPPKLILQLLKILLTIILLLQQRIQRRRLLPLQMIRHQKLLPQLLRMILLLN